MCPLTVHSSGPSQTYPQRAYRNPLDRLVAFLDAKHRDNWAIWEFRAEGTGYPDEAVYGRIRHYPWPDHHPPPFRLVPMIVASMRNWLNGEDDDLAGANITNPNEVHAGKPAQKKDGDSKRVVVVHCKAGKGRSGTMACSYLISQCGWTPEDALARFTGKRMRPQFGAGVSIPSQLRTISYVDRWTRGGKKYVDREVEITEVHVWGLRHGVKVSVEGFADEGKKIQVLHTFSKKERYIVQGDAPGGGGVMDFLGDALSPLGDDEEIYEDADYNEIVDADKTKNTTDAGNKQSTPSRSQSKKGSRTSLLLRNRSVKKLAGNPKSKTINPADFATPPSDTSTPTSGQSTLTLPNPDASRPVLADTAEPGGMAVIFKPSSPVRIANSDINVSLERRNRTPAYMGLTMVTAVAHVWFNAFFEGNGPENDGKAEESGVFEIDWEKMDGIKGSSRKGTKAADRISVVWRVVGSQTGSTSPSGVVITEPGEGSPVPQMRPADWKGGDEEDPDKKRKLGLRAAEPGSAAVSRASSVHSEVGSSAAGGSTGTGGARDSDDDSLKGVQSHLTPGDDSDAGEDRGRSGPSSGHEAVGSRTLSEHEKKVEATKGRTENPDEASGAVKSQDELARADKSGLRGVEGSVGGGPQIVDTSSDSAQHAEGKGGEVREEGDTTHLGFVKRGKKLLPMHGRAEESEAGEDSGATIDGEDPKIMHASVKK